MQQNIDRLEEFICSDEKEESCWNFSCTGGRLKKLRNQFLANLSRLRTKIRNINESISAQQQAMRA